MDRLEWCRENCPKLWRDLPDDELISKMTDAWEIAQLDNKTESEEPMEEHSLNIVNNHLDYMVIELTKEFGNKLAFKGGYMLTKLMNNRARQTSDIDFSILTADIYNAIKTKLVDVCDHLISVGAIDSYKIKDNIQPNMSGGADMYKDGKKILGVDVGWHDITYGTCIRNLDVGELNSFEIERMLADKITAILSRKRFRRPKDLYDLYCISECMEFNAKKISDYIIKRTNGIGADWANLPFTADVLREYEKAYNSLRLESVYKDVELVRPKFSVVIDRFECIANKVKNPEGNVYWSLKKECFVKEDGKI